MHSMHDINHFQSCSNPFIDSQNYLYIYIQGGKIIFKKMHEDIGMGQCQKPVKLGD